MSKALLPIFLVVVVDILGMTIVLPLLPFYAEHLGASATVVGMVVSSFAVCQLFGGPILGRLSDRFGRRPLLLVSQVGTLIGFIILAFAHNLWLLFLSRIIDGFTAGNISLAQAYIADVTKPEERTRAFAFIGIAFGVGFLIGPALSGFLSQFGYIYPILVAIGLSATSILATWLFLPKTKALPASAESRRLSLLEWSRYAAYFRQPGLGALLTLFFLFVLAFTSFMSGFPLFAERRYTVDAHPFTAREVGYVYAYVGVIGILVQGGMLSRLSKVWGDWRIIQFGFLSGVIGFSALAFTREIPALLLAAIPITFTSSLIRPAVTSLITRATDRSEQGSVLGLTQSLQSIAQIFMPLLAGVLIDHSQLGLWCFLAAILCLAAFLVPKPPQAAAAPTVAAGHR
ncbi:MAG TPA: MFS transporter [Bryobacteraceae bacterium]|nr:MFS transporter [Bryobacteraceae bacterium]